jgi:UDP-3-O-[3-hydroxymyristoyl] glucosamine N-acyltransferase
MQFTARDISLLLNGTIEGDPLVTVNRLAKIEEATAGALSFLANPRYESFLYSTNASVVIVNKDQVLTEPVTATLVRVENAYSSFAVLLEKYNSIKLEQNRGGGAFFHPPNGKNWQNVYIGAFAYIGPNVTVGDNCKIYPNSFIADNVSLGNIRYVIPRCNHLF